MFWWGTKKFWINASWICLLSVSSWVAATPSDWNIFPSTCVNDKPGELCRIEITVNFPESIQKQPQKVCFVLNEEPLRCVMSNVNPVKFPIEITQTGLLKVLIDDQLVVEKELLVQSLAPKNKRRRVRNPWSFF